MNDEKYDHAQRRDPICFHHLETVSLPEVQHLLHGTYTGLYPVYASSASSPEKNANNKDLLQKWMS